MMLSRALTALIISLFMVSCSPADLPEKIIPDQDEVAGQELNQLLFSRDLDGLLERATEDFRAVPDIRSDLEKYLASFPSGEPDESMLAGYHRRDVIYNDEMVRRTELVYDVRYDEAWFRIGYFLFLRDGENRLQHLSINSIDEPFSETAAFRVSGKSAVHILVLGLVIALPLFCIFTFVQVIRTRGVRLKWLWCVFVLLGFYGWNFDWDSGQFSANFLQIYEGGWNLRIVDILILSAGVLFQGAWTLKISLPLGAILFWVFHRKKPRGKQPEPIDASVFSDPAV